MKLLLKSPQTDHWVVNASPVIALARVGQVELLTRLPARAYMPQAVVAELLRAPHSDPARQAVELGLFHLIPTSPSPTELLAWDLGAGETSVLATVLSQPQWVAILDDGAARRCARSFSVSVLGTLAVVILAKQHGLIESAARVLDDLRRADFRLNENLIREVLARTVGETWSPTP